MEQLKAIKIYEENLLISLYVFSGQNTELAPMMFDLENFVGIWYCNSVT